MLKVANSVISATRITGVLPVLNGGTGVTTSTGTGNTVLSAAPTLSGNVTLSTGNLIIGTSGKGIDFTATSSGSGTMTSELLSDYEEGTWTPSLTNMTVVGSPDVAGTYTKIGRLVYFECRVAATSIASTAGTSSISGLPFTAGQVSSFIAINASSSVAIGSGQVNGIDLYTPTFGPLGVTISCSGSYEV